MRPMNDPVRIVQGEDKTLRFTVVDHTIVSKLLNELERAQATEMVVESSDGYASAPSAVKIADEIILFAAESGGNKLTTLTRGAAASVHGVFASANHPVGAEVWQVPNVSGWTTKADVRKPGKVTAAIEDIAGAITSADKGIIDIVLTSAQTAALAPGSYEASLRRTDTGGNTQLAKVSIQIVKETTT